MSELSTAVCSIIATQRRRYFWAAWWTGVPSEAPFRAPDASNGGASSLEAALADAERIAGRHLVIVEHYWAHAWNRILRNEAPPRRRVPRERPARRTDERTSDWSMLLLAPGASLVDVKRAYRTRARETHPDHGGDADEFRRVQRAYERLEAKLVDARPRKRR